MPLVKRYPRNFSLVMSPRMREALEQAAMASRLNSGEYIRRVLDEHFGLDEPRSWRARYVGYEEGAQT